MTKHDKIMYFILCGVVAACAVFCACLGLFEYWLGAETFDKSLADAVTFGFAPLLVIYFATEMVAKEYSLISKRQSKSYVIIGNFTVATLCSYATFTLGWDISPLAFLAFLVLAWYFYTKLWTADVEGHAETRVATYAAVTAAAVLFGCAFNLAIHIVLVKVWAIAAAVVFIDGIASILFAKTTEYSY